MIETIKILRCERCGDSKTLEHDTEWGEITFLERKGDSGSTIKLRGESLCVNCGNDFYSWYLRRKTK